MTAQAGQPAQVGEYDEGMQTLLQIVWGDGFLSPGGPDEVARVLEGCDIRGSRVLDIGCGLGAIDLEPDLVAKARARAAEAGLAGRIDLKVVAAGPLEFADQSFDVVFSKDSLVQIPDKRDIFAEVRRVLRPGGQFIVSDWLRGGSGDYSPEMLEYFRLEGITYNMASPDESRDALIAAGFVDVEVRDRCDWYRDLARRELELLAGEYHALLVSRLGEQRARHFVANWRQLVLVLERGELRPAHLRARRPAAGGQPGLPS